MLVKNNVKLVCVDIEGKDNENKEAKGKKGSPLQSKDSDETPAPIPLQVKVDVHLSHWMSSMDCIAINAENNQGADVISATHYMSI